jgi:hypothetical protein
MLAVNRFPETTFCGNATTIVAVDTKVLCRIVTPPPDPAGPVAPVAPVAPAAPVAPTPGIHAATLVAVIVGLPVTESHAAVRSIAFPAVVSMLHVELACMDAAEGVRTARELLAVSKMQFAIWVPPAPAVLVVTSQNKRQTPFVMFARTVIAPVVIWVDPPIFTFMVSVRAATGVV